MSQYVLGEPDGKERFSQLRRMELRDCLVTGAAFSTTSIPGSLSLLFPGENTWDRAVFSTNSCCK